MVLSPARGILFQDKSFQEIVNTEEGAGPPGERSVRAAGRVPAKGRRRKWELVPAMGNINGGSPNEAVAVSNSLTRATQSGSGSRARASGRLAAVQRVVA